MAAAKSQTALAAELGIAQPSVSKLCRHPEWPVKRRGPWSAGEVAKVAAWRATLQEDRSAEPAADGAPGGGDLRAILQKANIALKVEQTKTAKLKREAMEAERVTREQFEGGLGGLAMLMVEEVEGLRLAIPSRFPDVDPDKLDLLLDGALRRIADTLQVEARKVDEVVAAAGTSRRGRPRKDGA